MPSFLMIQWGIIGFFVGIHFLIGFLRGSSKSTYFTIVSIILTVVTLLIVTSISFSWVFGLFSFSSMLQLAQNYTGGSIPAQYVTYLEDPAITGFIVAIMDLVLRIVAYFILYPLIKFSLTLTIFRPIWKHGVKKAILKKQNEKQEIIFEEKDDSGKKFVPSKRLKKGILGRFFGGTMGAVRGFIVAFVFLIPILVLSSYVSQVSSAVTLHESSDQTLSTGDQNLIAIPSEIQEILDNINEMNQGGLTAFTKDITIGGRPLDQYIFNSVFTTQIKDATDQVTQLNFGEELEGIFGIAGILIDGGYLDDNFDFGSISSDNLADIEQMFTYISRSDLLTYLIPFATEYGLKVALPEMTDYDNPYDNPAAVDALDAFTSIDWSLEFMNIYGIIESVLEFGSVDELMNYADNPELLLEMTPEEATLFADVFRAFGDMQTLVLINAGISYGLTLDVVKSNITWVDPEDVEAYLTNRLGFISDNPEFFIGEDGEISRLASLIETVFTDEFGDVDLALLFNSMSDPAAFLDAQNPDWIGAIIDKIVDLELIVESIPIGVDFGMYTVLGDQIEATLAEDIQTALDDIEWDAEIMNIGDIYTEALKLGLSSALGADADTFGFIDDVVINHMDSLRTIVANIFEDSQIVNVAIEVASPAIVDRFVTDETLKDLVNEALISDPVAGVVDFNFGQEINSILTILESVYGFTTVSDLQSFSTLTLDGKVELFAQFGSLTALEFTDFEDAFKELQILDRLGVGALDYAKTTLGIEELYVPSEVNLGDDVASILGLAYYAAKFTYDNQGLYTDFEFIDFAPLLADDTFRSYLLSTVDENHSNLLFTNIAYNIQRFSEDASMSQYIAIPSTLALEDPESTIWETEVNAFLGAILDIGASFEGSAMSLSAHNVLSLSADTSTANMELFTQFADITKANEAFSSLDSSQILRTSLVAIIDSLGDSTVSSLGFALTTPEIAMDGEMLAQGMIVELINGLAIVAADAFETMNINTLADVSANGGTSAYLNAFSELEDESLDALGNITIMRGMISDALQNPDMQAYLVDTINTSQDLIAVDDTFFAVDPILLDIDGALKPEEFSGLLISIRSLGLTDSAALSSLGVDTFTGLIDKNIDIVTGEDDFDRVLGSGYLYITLDKILQLDAIGTFVSDTLGTSLGTDMSSFDLTLPVAMLGNDVDNEAIEVDRIPKDEFRRMVTSLSVLGDLSTMGLDTFSNLVDPTLPADDFTTFIASDFIYVVLARLFENDGFGDYVSDMLGGSFGDTPITLDMSVPVDAKGTSGVEDAMISRVELRNIMISFDLLDIGGETTPSVETMMTMIDPAESPDDMTLFLQSLYISDKISQLLLSEAITDVILTGNVTHEEFVDSIPEVSKTDSGSLTPQGIYNIFNGLNVLGISDLSSGSSSIGIDTVTSLDSTELDELLASGYLYSLIDVMIKDQASTLGLPADAYETSGDFDGMIKKTEVKNLLNAFDILGTNDPSTIDVDSITIAKIIELLDLDSPSIDQLMSDGIIDALGSAPVSAYNTEGTRLSRDEMYSVTDVLLILSEDGFGVPDDQMSLTDLTPIDTTDITRDRVRDFYNLDSRLIDRILSTAIIDSGISIHSLSYAVDSELDPVDSHKLDIDRTELLALIDALDVLEIDISNASAIDTSTFTPLKIDELLDLGSPLIYRLVSEGIIDQGLQTDESLAADGIDMNYDPDAPGSDIKPDEMKALVQVMIVLGIVNLSVSIDVNTITVAQLRETHYLGLGTDPVVDTYDSRIIHRLLSDAIDDAVTVPDDAYMTVDKFDMLPGEVGALIEALAEMGLTTLTDPIDVNTLTVTQLRNIHYLGLGVDPVDDQFQSLTINRLISESVITAVTIPDDAYMTAAHLDVEPLEIGALIEALGVMGLANLGAPIDVTALTVAQLRNIHYLGLGVDPVLDTYESLTINRMISESVITTVTIPDDAYVTGSILDVKPEEIGALIEALDVMGLANLGDPIDVDTLTVAQLRSIHYLGLGIDPVLDTFESLTINRLISESVITAVTIPDDAYMAIDHLDVKPLEIGALIEALDVMGLANLGDPIDVNTLTITQLRNIHYLGLGIDPVLDSYESLTINRLISESVILAVTIPDDAYVAIDHLDVQPLEIGALIEALDVMGLATLGDPIDVNALTIAQLRNIHYLGLGIDPVVDSYESLTINRLISESVILAVTIPDDAYVAIDHLDVKPLEIGALIEALDVMGLATLGDPIDVNTLTTTQLRNIHYLGLGTDPVSDLYESLIINRLISESVILAVTVPDDAYMTIAQLDVLPDETSALIDALDVMGLTTLGDPIDVNALTTTQLRNIHYLGLGTDPVSDLYESLIINRLISESVILAVTVPDDAYMTIANLDVLPDETSALIDALDEMGLATLGDPIDVNILTTTQLRNIHYLGIGTNPVVDLYDSLIINRLISEAVIAAVDVPDDAYILGSVLDVQADETSALIDALDEMGLSTLGDPIDVNGLSTTQLRNIHYLGLGTDPVLDVYESLIIHRMVSTSVISAVDVPDDAYMLGSLTDVQPDEISALVEAMDVMSITSLGISLSFSDPTVSQLSDLHDLGLNVPVGNVYDSLIVHRLISTTMISAIDVPDDAYMTIAHEDILPDEISATIEAMNVMSITNLGVSLVFTNPTVSQLSDLHDLGLNVPIGNVYDSLIVHRLISSALSSAMTVPNEAYMTVAYLDIKPAEISHIIVSMGILGVANVSDVSSSISVASLKALSNDDINDLVEPPADPNVIVYYMIDDVIQAGMSPAQVAYALGQGWYNIDGRIFRQNIVDIVAYI